MKITYKKMGDYYLPNLKIFTQTNESQNLGRFGKMRLNYLKEYKKGLYISLKMKNELYKHLIETEKACNRRIKIILKEYIVQQNIDENQKEKNQIK